MKKVKALFFAASLLGGLSYINYAHHSSGAATQPDVKNSVEKVTTETPNPKTEEATAPTSEHLIENFPLIYQMPELPTGCEITALTMVLNYYDLPADKVELATVYLPTLPSRGLYTGSDGRLYGNDLNQYFIGDPTTEGGFICGTAAIVTAAEAFLKDRGSSLHVVDRSGSTPEELYSLIDADIPCIVWCTIEMQNRIPQQGWYTEEGEYVDWSMCDHGAVLIGYDEEQVTIADPISGFVSYEKQQFEKVFLSRGNQCVTLEN